MNYRAIVTMGTLLALGIAACDPYDDAAGGAPVIVGGQIATFDVDAFDVADFQAAYPSSPAIAGATAGTWTITSDNAEKSVIQLFANKLLDGATIQTTPTDCTPAGNWLQVAPPTGCPWYSCYQPSSPTAAQGATLLLFQSCGPVTAADGPFDVAEPLPAGTFHLTNAPNTVADRGGQPLTVDVTVTIPGT